MSDPPLNPESLYPVSLYEVTHLKMLQFDTWKLYENCAHILDITSTEMWILLALDQTRSPVSQADIARIIRIPVQTVNSACSKMIRRGWLELKPLKTNHKSKIVTFTDAGREKCLPFARKVQMAEAMAMSNLSAEEFRQMLHGVEKYNRHLHEQMDALVESSKEDE